MPAPMQREASKVALSEDMYESLNNATTAFNLKCSPLNAVTLPSDARDKASIPQDASFYCFCCARTARTEPSPRTLS